MTALHNPDTQPDQKQRQELPTRTGQEEDWACVSQPRFDPPQEINYTLTDTRPQVILC